MSSKILNTGGVLSVFSVLKHQHAYQYGHDGFEIIAKNDFFLPFYFELSGAAQTVNEFLLINYDTGQTFDIPVGNISKPETPSNAETFYIYKANTSLGLGAPCGRYFFKIDVNGVFYYTGIMDVRDICENETAGLAYDSCAAGVFTFDIDDTLNSSIDYARTEYYSENNQVWVEMTETFSQVTLDRSGTGVDNERRRIRRVVKTACGNTLQSTYIITFGDPDPCVGYKFDLFRYDNKYPNPNLWKLTFTNSTSIDRIPYEASFSQFFYIEMYPSPAEPVREQEVLINGEGDEVATSALTKEKLVFTVRNIPHHLLYMFTQLNDLDTVTLTRVSDGLVYSGLSEIEFSSEAKDFQSDGVLKFKTRKQYTAGCEEDMSLTVS